MKYMLILNEYTLDIVVIKVILKIEICTQLINGFIYGNNINKSNKGA